MKVRKAVQPRSEKVGLVCRQIHYGLNQRAALGKGTGVTTW